MHNSCVKTVLTVTILFTATLTFLLFYPFRYKVEVFADAVAVEAAIRIRLLFFPIMRKRIVYEDGLFMIGDENGVQKIEFSFKMNTLTDALAASVRLKRARLNVLIGGDGGELFGVILATAAADAVLSSLTAIIRTLTDADFGFNVDMVCKAKDILKARLRIILRLSIAEVSFRWISSATSRRFHLNKRVREGKNE